MDLEEKLYFTSIKEGRGEYFVEYRPPFHGFSFATLQLTFPNEVTGEAAARAMELEGLSWLSKYPVPLMVSSFGPSGDLVCLSGVRPNNHYMLYPDAETGEARDNWRFLKSEEMPQGALTRDRLLAIYSGLPYRTSRELEASAKKSALKMRLGWYVVFVWAVVVPSAFLMLEYFGPGWLATVVFLYGVYKAVEKALKMTGRWKKSANELAKEEEDLLMRHHHYHCQRNPEGFLRLKLKNFEKEQRERILRESAALNGSREAD